MGNKSPPAEGRAAQRPADKNCSWQTLASAHSAHSECHCQHQECFNWSISSEAAFYNQHNSCSLSGLSSLSFPQRTRTNSVIFQLKISCSWLFSGSVPPIHLPKSLGGLWSFPQFIFPKEKWKWQNISCLIYSPLVQSSMAKMLIRAKSLEGMTEF